MLLSLLLILSSPGHYSYIHGDRQQIPLEAGKRIVLSSLLNAISDRLHYSHMQVYDHIIVDRAAGLSHNRPALAVLPLQTTTFNSSVRQNLQRPHLVQPGTKESTADFKTKRLETLRCGPKTATHPPRPLPTTTACCYYLACRHPQPHRKKQPRTNVKTAYLQPLKETLGSSPTRQLWRTAAFFLPVFASQQIDKRNMSTPTSISKAGSSAATPPSMITACTIAMSVPAATRAMRVRFIACCPTACHKVTSELASLLLPWSQNYDDQVA